jgi:hypothetical protein
MTSFRIRGADTGAEKTTSAEADNSLTYPYQNRGWRSPARRLPMRQTIERLFELVEANAGLRLSR